MSTPNFKLLANALRLGQPPDPLLAFRVLVEVIQHQETELAELRQRVSMLTSRLQFTEAKASRVEAATLGEAPMSSAAVRTPTFGPPPAGAAHPGEQTGQQLAAAAAAAAAQAQPVMPQPQPQMQQIPAMPPIPKEAKKRVDPHPELAPMDDSDVTLGTLVVARADIDAVVKNVSENEAPYPLSPPGGQRPAAAHAMGETSGMPFKAARPLDPTGGTLKGSASKNQSRPPPPGIPAIPVIPGAPAIPGGPPIPAAPKIPSKPLSGPPAPAAALRPPAQPPPAQPPAALPASPHAGRGPARVLPRPRPEPSAPYIAIEDMAGDDTFSSTSESLDVVYPEAFPVEMGDPLRGGRRPKDAPAEAAEARPGREAPSLLDDGSFDDSAMTILTRRPNGQGR